MGENIHKIWGERRRIHLDDKHEIDLLYIKKDSFCSIHQHKYKINKFIVIKGSVRIDTDYGVEFLNQNDTFTVEPPTSHRFYALEDSIMVEIAYVYEDVKIDPNDIYRYKQGGRVINGKEMTLDEMKQQGLLNFKRN